MQISYAYFKYYGGIPAHTWSVTIRPSQKSKLFTVLPEAWFQCLL